jgi:hypothetical protein
MEPPGRNMSITFFRVSFPESAVPAYIRFL